MTGWVAAGWVGGGLAGRITRGCGRGADLVSDLGSGGTRGAGGVGNWSARGAGGMTICGDGVGGVPIDAGGIGAGGIGGDCAFAAAVIAALTDAIRMAFSSRRALLIQLPPPARGGEPLRRPPRQCLQ